MKTVLSVDRKYRYVLHRQTQTRSTDIATIIGLNPSTADETQDDPTIRRCKRFAEQWFCGHLLMVNLFAYRATDPDDLFKVDRKEVVGPLTDRYLLESMQKSKYVVAAWGNHGTYLDRYQEVTEMAHKLGIQLYYIKMNSTGQPAHPLYLPYHRDLIPWNL